MAKHSKNENTRSLFVRSIAVLRGKNVKPTAQELERLGKDVRIIDEGWNNVPENER